MTQEDRINFRPDLSKAGEKGTEASDAVFTWFSPVEDPASKIRYAVIKEEDGVLSIQPGEGRFKRGLQAWRFADQDGEDHTVWVVLKTRPNRIDLEKSSS
jgi:hypothetical protein